MTIEGVGELRMATVGAQDATVVCCIAYVPEASLGDYVVIQAGFAVAVLPEQDALTSLALFAALDALGG